MAMARGLLLLARDQIKLFVATLMVMVGVAPSQCFSLGGNHTTSPDGISSIGPPSPGRSRSRP